MRTVLVSGASGDIGIAVCRRYVAAGWRVIGHFHTSRRGLDALAGPELETWQADFADTASLEARLKAEPGFFARADAFINLAAAFRPGRFDEATASSILNSLAVNLLPGLMLMQTLGPAMAARGFGRMVHASSIGVKFGGGSDSFAYAVAKHALEFIPRACRQWSASNVFVNVARIGVTDTKLHARAPAKDMAHRVGLIPAGRMASPAEIAEALYWLGSERNGFTNGEVIAIAGGE